MTEKCKELARADGATVYVVSVGSATTSCWNSHELTCMGKTTKNKNELSKEVHRVGWHFPSSVVSRACMSLGIDISQSGRALKRHHKWPKEVPRSKQTTKDSKVEGQSQSQVEIDAQAKAAIKDLFPAIPPNDLHQIVDHAFDLVRP